MKYLIFLFILVLSSQGFALTIDEIKSSGEYYYSIGIAEDVNEASDVALNELLNQISISVSSSYSGKVKEVNGNVDQSAELIVKSHTQGTLNNVQKFISSISDGMEVFLYIKKTEVSKIFEDRKKLICELYAKAKELEDENNFGYALRYYYFSAILLNSIPDQTVIFNGINVTTEIPHHINDIILNTDFEFVRTDSISTHEKLVTLKINNKGKPVSYIEFTFWDGSSQITVTGKDGYATVNLIGESVNFDKLDITVKYSFYECREENREVANLWDVVIRPSFKSTKQVSLIDSEKIHQNIDKKLETGSFAVVISNITTPDGINLELKNKENCPVIENIRTDTLALINIIKTGQTSSYNGDSFLKDKLKRIIEYNRPMLSGSSFNADVNKTVNGWEVRKIMVLSRYNSIRINKQESESVILDFNEEGKLEDVNFGIFENLYNKFVEQSEYGKDWGNRQIIIKFIERYRTAFLNKDIQTIDSIFSDNAVIIVGREVKTKPLSSDAMKYQPITGNQPKIEYLRLKKDEFLERQKGIFQTQKDIFINFSTFKIMKHGTTEGLYGVDLRQNYYSTSYADEGHLFLYIDFNEKLPLIYVRAWQPQEWSQDAIVNISNFKLFK